MSLDEFVEREVFEAVVEWRKYTKGLRNPTSEQKYRANVLTEEAMSSLDHLISRREDQDRGKP